MSGMAHPPDSSDTPKQHYLIASATQEPLTRFAQVFAEDPDTEIVRTIGATDQPIALVVNIAPERAQQLQAQYQGQLTIEPDAPLHLSTEGSRVMSTNTVPEAGPQGQPSESSSSSSAGTGAATKPAANRPTAQRTHPAATAAADTETPASTHPPVQGASVQSRKQQFMIAPTKPALVPQGFAPLSLQSVEQSVQADPDIDFVKTIPRPQVAFATLSTDPTIPQEVVVAQMHPERAEQLKGLPTLTIEVDHPLKYSLPQPSSVTMATAVANPGILVPSAVGFTVNFAVQGSNGAPIADAQVLLAGTIWPASGTTDANGQVSIKVVGQSPNTIQGLYVDPKADYWDLWIVNPALDPTQTNVVSLTPLDETFPHFPDQQMIGWGLKAMRIDQLPEHYRGKGVKVAVVDSGIATTHRNLGQVESGEDLSVSPANAQTWNQDLIGHGSHCAGIIAGQDNGIGIRGIAPDATVTAIKVFPGGAFSTLLEALNTCMQDQVDVINLSLGTDQSSAIIDGAIGQMKQLGIACIVAAGNSGGVVEYPATNPNVLAVSAIGQQGTFPQDSYHAQQVAATNVAASADGYFSAKFTCVGPQVAVTGPGVAIVSSVPPNNFAAWDGTSMATPHITGLAALILAHHPDFQPQGPYAARNAQRVERLFQIIQQSAQPLNFGDPQRTGRGLPDALRALNLSPAITQPTSLPPDIVQRVLELIRSQSAQQPPAASAGVPVAMPQSAGPAVVSPQSVGPMQFSPQSAGVGQFTPQSTTTEVIQGITQMLPVLFSLFQAAGPQTGTASLAPQSVGVPSLSPQASTNEVIQGITQMLPVLVNLLETAGPRTANGIHTPVMA